MKEKIRLKIPNEQELEYRRQLISDEETMSYNMGYGDNGGCTYIRTYEQVRLWYKNWSNNKDRFYSYIVRNSDNKFIGEVNIYKSNPWFEMGIVIESKYRGMGYSSYALKLLLYHAFENMNANAVHNSFEDTRTAAIKTHISAGFKEIKHQNGIIEFLITKEEYYMLNALKNKKYKAIFFDRDGTLTYFNPEKEKYRDELISSWSGKPFELPYEKMMNLFQLASEGRKPWYKNLSDEIEFFKRYYYHLLIGEGVTDDTAYKAEILFSELWCNNDRLLFDEAIEVLEYFYKNGYKIGVISDTSPSLEYTLKQLGIAHYFTSFTASSLVGAGKPSPIIFNAALKAQGVSADESIYVDDYKPEADGAREQGFTSFWLDRSGSSHDIWTISNLKQLIDLIEKNKYNEDIDTE